MSDYEEDKINELAASVGLNLDKLTDAMPLFHYGPGGCNGVDHFEVYSQVIALIVAERQRCVGMVRAVGEDAIGYAWYHPQVNMRILADRMEGKSDGSGG